MATADPSVSAAALRAQAPSTDIPTWQMAVAGIAIVTALAAPRLVLAPVVAIAAIAVATGLSRQGVQPAVREMLRQFRDRHWLLLAATAAFAGWLALSILWAPDAINSAGKVLLFGTLAAVTAAVSMLAARAPAAALDRFGRALLVGLATGAAFLLIEEITGHTLKSIGFSLLPSLKPDARHMAVDADMGERVQAYVTNRNVAMLVLLAWPAAALATRVMRPDRARIALIALAVVTAATAALSVHASSRLALAAGVAIYVTARFAPRTAVYAAAAVWIVLTLAMVPVASGLYARGLHLDERVPYSFRARIILWNYTADRIPERLWRGVGIDGTKLLDAARKKQWETRPGHVYPQRTGEHAHNIYIQVWHELGAIGAALFMAFGLVVLRAIGRVPVEMRAAGYAGFVTAAALGATSWGLWQPWFMGAYCLSAIVFVIATARTALVPVEPRSEPRAAPAPRPSPVPTS